MGLSNGGGGVTNGLSGVEAGIIGLEEVAAGIDVDLARVPGCPVSVTKIYPEPTCILTAL